MTSCARSARAQDPFLVLHGTWICAAFALCSRLEMSDLARSR